MQRAQAILAGARRATASSMGSKYEPFFRYTSGRWLYNEKQQLSARYVRFNVDALKHVAAEAVGAARCTDIRKTHEGMFNKIFTLSLDNNTELIAKIPTPLVSPPHLVTASEVTTMDYARTVMGIPVPRVLGWCSRAEKTEVSVEYILMEKINGVELDNVWHKIRMYDSLETVGSLLLQEFALSKHHFSQTGSLYYKEDVDPVLQTRPLYANGKLMDTDASERFRIGPLVTRDVWSGSRVKLSVNRGPWPDALSFLSGVACVQEEYLHSYARSAPAPLNVPKDDPSYIISIHRRFLQLARFLLPDTELSHPVLWHTDLHRSNILMPPSGKPPIAAILDWQTVSVLPLILNATIADYINTADEIDPRIDYSSMDTANLPSNFSELPEDEKEHLRLHRDLALRIAYYYTFVEEFNPLQQGAFTHPFRGWLTNGMLHLYLSCIFGVHTLRGILIKIEKYWKAVSSEIPFPCPMESHELERHRVESERLSKYEENIERVRAEVGIRYDGLVSCQDYLLAKKLNEKTKLRWREEEMGGPYPFQDGVHSGWLDI